MAEVFTGAGSNPSGPLADITYPNPPAPERMFPEVTDHEREPQGAPPGSGLQPKTQNNPDGQIEPMRLSALQ